MSRLDYSLVLIASVIWTILMIYTGYNLGYKDGMQDVFKDRMKHEYTIEAPIIETISTKDANPILFL